MAKESLKWTDAQRRAIETRGTDLLVAASAGTGKTAVLVERCIRLVTDPIAPVDLDRLLVVTFTEAAAAEMRNRIGEALQRQIAQQPADVRLRRQLMLLDRAMISTLHSFALRLIQEHFFRLGLDPNLTVQDPDEGLLLRHETLDDLFESLYTDESETGRRFARLIEHYGRDGDDAPVRCVVLDLWEFLRSLPQPDRWKREVLDSYPKADETPPPFKQLRRWHEPFVAALREDLLQIESDLGAAAQWAGSAIPFTHGIMQHFQSIAAEMAKLRNTLESKGYDAFHAAMKQWDYPTLRINKSVAEELKQKARARNDRIRKAYHDLCKQWCALSGAEWVETLRATREGVEMMFYLVGRFDAEFARVKRERGEVDFGDIERFCFDLLCDKVSEGDRYTPSEVARKEIRDRFEAVLVDEYQDINPLQDAIIRLCARENEAERPPNLFMVGDVKQSIYRFRLAEPKLFLQRLAAFRPEGGAGVGQCIDLSENHRSRLGLLEAINALCRRIMAPEVGGIVYDSAAELRGGFDFPEECGSDIPPPTSGLPVEIHFFDRAREETASNNDKANTSAHAAEIEPADGTEDSPPAGAVGTPDELEQIEIEAHWVAGRIRAMLGGEFSIWDRGEGRYRPVARRDIAVLLQTAAYKAALFVRILRAQGIPAYTDAPPGQFLPTEIRDLFALLELLDNPCQDIPLAAVLRSPLVRLSEDDLARIRIHRREGGFFSAAYAYAESGPDERLRRRLREFFDCLERWRTLARRGPLARALWTIYDETGYLDYVTAMDDGAQRRANLIGLYDRARQFDEFQRRGLGRFIQFIRQLQETENELATPSAVSEADDVVRVMSIHKSKGLEFPVVFLADIGKKFNFQNALGDVVTDRSLGVALRAVVPRRKIKYPTLAHVLASRRVEREILAENIRLLYVAMTRAREKLVLCGSVELDKALRVWSERAAAGGNDGRIALSAGVLSSARSFSDWIGPALARLGCWSGADQPTLQAHPMFAVHLHRAEEIRGLQTKGFEPAADEETLRKIATLQPVDTPPHDRQEVTQIVERLTWHYAARPLTRVRGKMSVSEIKRRFETGRESDEAPDGWGREAMVRRPAFMAAAAGESPLLTATEIGTATHAVLRHLDLSQPADEATVRSQIAQIAAKGKLTAAEAAVVDAAAIARFLQSPLGTEIRQAPGRAWREMPFSLAVPALEIARLERGFFEKDGLDRSDKLDIIFNNEWVQVQGIIDLLFERPEGFVLLDFKTDRIESGEVPARAAFYRPQMEFYARAAETIFRRPVVEQVLYFLSCGVAVSDRRGTEGGLESFGF
ncbi:MAG: helicase-exonuclease AddAB subunit AddA [Candidatus Sumerlaeia bacterium]|nr:helicase-exonuclease AddAB subunit AddA [Candidatus Sumerlaeia bacterium]